LINSDGDSSNDTESEETVTSNDDPQSQSNSTGLTIDQVVNMLADIYSQHPQGIYSGTPAETQVRAIGKALHEAGGMQLMLHVHQQFRAIYPHHARNLEMKWGGIGGWMG
jgi:hypothetical protein